MKNNRREERISDLDLQSRVAAAATSAEGAPPLLLAGREFSPPAGARDGLPPLPWDVFVAACGFARADDSSDSAFSSRVVSLAARAPRLLRRRDAAIDHTAGARLPATAARAASDLAPVLRELDARFFAPADDDAAIDRNLRAAAQTARAQIEDPDDEKLFAAWLAAASRADYPARRVARGLARFCRGNRRAVVFVGGEPEDDPPFARAFFDLIEASGAPLLVARPPRAARESFLRELWREEFDPPAPSAPRPRPRLGAAAIGVSRAPNRWSARPKPRSPRSKRCRRTRASRRSRSIARWRGGFAPAPRRAESFCATPPVGAPRLSSSARRFCASPPRLSPSTRAPISKR